jgi:protein NrfD
MTDLTAPVKTEKIVRSGRFSFRLRKTDPFWIVGLALLLAGAWSMYQRVVIGLEPTALTSYIPWGLWVGVYDYLVWLEVGSLLVFTTLAYVLDFKALKAIKPVVLLTGFVVLVMALFLVLVDLGRMERFWFVMLYPDFGSMITWMVWLHSAYLLLLSAELGLLFWGGKKGEKLMKPLAYLSLPLGVGLIVVSGSILGVVSARPLWNTSMLPVMFFLSSLAAGSALLLLLAVVFWPKKQAKEYREVLERLSRIVAGLMLIGVFAAALIALTALYQGSPGRTSALNLILTGPYWWTFWIVHLLMGVTIPLIILLSKPRSPGWLGAAAVLSVISFVAVTLNLVIPVLITIELQGLATSFNGPKLLLDYFPNAMEWLVLAFIVGLGATIFGLAVRWLPVLPEPREASK